MPDSPNTHTCARTQPHTHTRRRTRGESCPRRRVPCVTLGTQERHILASAGGGGCKPGEECCNRRRVGASWGGSACFHSVSSLTRRVRWDAGHGLLWGCADPLNEINLGLHQQPREDPCPEQLEVSETTHPTTAADGRVETQSRDLHLQ